MRRLIWGFAGRTYHIVWNRMLWLKLFALIQSDVALHLQVHLDRAIPGIDKPVA